MVLHDLNQACRYAHQLVAMKDGAIVASGEPQAVVTPALVSEVFGLECVVIDDPVAGTPLVIPAGIPDRRLASASTHPGCMPMG
jgi:iron complex transport system ATP-binding protein